MLFGCDCWCSFDFVGFCCCLFGLTACGLRLDWRDFGFCYAWCWFAY